MYGDNIALGTIYTAIVCDFTQTLNYYTYLWYRVGGKVVAHQACI